MRFAASLYEREPLARRRSQFRIVLRFWGDRHTGPVRVEVGEERVLRILEHHRGVQTRAAEVLGISERVLRYKLRKYGLGGEGPASG